MAKHFPPAPSTLTDKHDRHADADGNQPTYLRATFLIKSLSTDAAAGATRSVEESSKLATTRAKIGKGQVGTGARKSPAEAGRSLRHRQSAETKLAELKHRLLEIERPQRRGRAAWLGSCHLHAEMRSRRAGSPKRHSQQAGARKVGRSATRQTARRARAPCRQPAPRLGRREPDTRGKARLRKGDQSPR